MSKLNVIFQSRFQQYAKVVCPRNFPGCGLSLTAHLSLPGSSCRAFFRAKANYHGSSGTRRDAKCAAPALAAAPSNRPSLSLVDKSVLQKCATKCAFRCFGPDRQSARRLQSDQNVITVRTPRTASSPSRRVGCSGLETPPPGSKTYWKSGCSCHHGVTCQR